MKRLESALTEQKIKYSLDDSVAKRSSFKIGGISAISIFPKTTQELCCAVNSAHELGIKFEIIGNASNILFAFERYNGALIFTSEIDSYSIDGEKIYAECGSSLVRISNVAKENSLSGLEFACGIPARIGGAIVMNAGAHGSVISDVVEYTDAFDIERGERIRIYDNQFRYRNSIYLENSSLVCLGASIALSKGKTEEISLRMRENLEKRSNSQPLSLPSAGSYFKRPEGYFAAKLIDDCGLKGFSIGGAQVSPKHAGFIVNTGNATSADVLELAEKIRETVMDNFGVCLESEVKYIC